MERPCRPPTTSATLLWLLLGLCSVAVAVAASGQELVTNGGFESSSLSGWVCYKCSFQRLSTRAYSGSSALEVTSRTKVEGGPRFNLIVQQGTRYRVQAYVKQLNDLSSKVFQTHMLKILINYEGGEFERKVLARNSMVRSVGCWFSLIGYFMVPSKSVTSAKIIFSGPEEGISYILDDVSLTDIAEDTAWKQGADARIDSIRKGDILIRMNLSSSVPPGNVTVQVDHKKHLFGFGSLVKDEFILQPAYKPYQDIVYDLFNVATLQSFKWKFDKGTQHNPDFSQALNAMHVLKSHGLEVRGHCLFWGFTKNVPAWVPGLSVAELNQTVQDRLHYMANITKGQLLHWDVMNELLHGQWFEEQLQDPHLTQTLFRQLSALDPHPTLMHNDFNIVSKPEIMDAQLRLAKQYLALGVPLGALGIQSHFNEQGPPDSTILKLRLDHVAKSGLPLWITEMDLLAQDPSERADRYEEAFRLYFSHPAVQGIVLWGFWDQHATGPEAALVDGFSYTFNEAGNRVSNLIKNEWSTHVSQALTSGSSDVTVRGFKGDYDVTVSVNGVPMKRTSFSLTGSNVTVTIGLQGDEAPLTTPPSPTTTTTTTVPPNNNDHVVGNATSTGSSSSSLQCVNRWSAYSLVGDDERAQVTCQEGQVLTGCSSILKNYDWHRDGEKIQMSNGKPACAAFNGFRSTQGVQAIATCCTARDLTCTYRAAGPSAAGFNSSVETQCSSSQVPLGCSAWNLHSGVGGVTPSGQTCLAFNQDPQAGVNVYGACCSAPGLSCVTVTSAPSGPHQGNKTNVKCPSGHVMTSCQAMSHHGKSSGSFSTAGGLCIAFNGIDLEQGQLGVKAVARCCHLSEDGLIGK